MEKLWTYKKLLFVALILVFVGIVLLNVEVKFKGSDVVKPVGDAANTEKQKFGDGLPNDADFVVVAETDKLILKFEHTFGHFQVEDKRNHNIYYSYPHPNQWETTKDNSGVWVDHSRSPLLLQYVDFSLPIVRQREINFISEGGTVNNYKEIENGIEFTFDMPGKGFSIPVRIRVKDDFVETTVLDSELVEKDLSITWMRLYSFFGAEQSKGQDGYMLIPDGSGSLITFKEDRGSKSRAYHEGVYGSDMSFQTTEGQSSRYPITVPVYGMKSDHRGFIAVMHEGEEYAEVFASPSGVFTKYNWITGQMRYRQPFFQVTNEHAARGFVTYNKEEPFLADRVVRYYILDEGNNDYVGMASRYRQYLVDEHGMERISNEDDTIPLHVTFVGGLVERGVVRDRYISATTTSEAMQMVQTLYGLGVEKMSITYEGWQKGGYASYGGLFPVDSRIGGTKGLKQFVQFAHTLDFPVYLEASYMYNNTGRDGFIRPYHGLRNLGGGLLSSGNIFNNFSLVSQRFLEKIVRNDLKKYEELDVDGIEYAGVGTQLNTDYNTNFGASRQQSKHIHEDILASTKERLGSVQGNAVNAYSYPYVDHIKGIADDYSFDTFSEHRIPFLQIALHGLVSYTTEYSNNREQFTLNFLRDIEYGALPSYIFTSATPDDLMKGYNFYFSSPAFVDWKDTAVGEYQRYNAALGDVQDQFIVGHRILASGVHETTYENGKRIIVNYNNTPSHVEGIMIPATDFIIVEGG